jgi:hypothetical protein
VSSPDSAGGRSEGSAVFSKLLMFSMRRLQRILSSSVYCKNLRSCSSLSALFLTPTNQLAGLVDLTELISFWSCCASFCQMRAGIRKVSNGWSPGCGAISGRFARSGPPCSVFSRKATPLGALMRSFGSLLEMSSFSRELRSARWEVGETSEAWRSSRH